VPYERYNEKGLRPMARGDDRAQRKFTKDYEQAESDHAAGKISDTELVDKTSASLDKFVSKCSHSRVTDGICNNCGDPA
jgi:hypothetical protein